MESVYRVRPTRTTRAPSLIHRCFSRRPVFLPGVLHRVQCGRLSHVESADADVTPALPSKVRFKGALWRKRGGPQSCMRDLPPNLADEWDMLTVEHRALCEAHRRLTSSEASAAQLAEHADMLARHRGRLRVFLEVLAAWRKGQRYLPRLPLH
jgi:hypothetical protein